ncbi:MAG: GNAT family N-acetyltransferase [Candidatus Edwardsbacteria bacterium]
MKGKKVNLRPIQKKDLSYLLKWWNDGEAMKSVGFPKGLRLTMKEMEKYWERWSNDPDKKMMIITLKNGKPIGEACFHDWHPELGETEVGLKICIPSLWNKGYGTDVLRTMCEYLFKVKKMRRVLANPSKTNYAMIRVNKKCGFKTIGEKNGGLLMELKNHSLYPSPSGEGEGGVGYRQNLVGRCGLYCGACEIYRAYKDSEKLREEIASKHHCLPEEVRCEGCQTLEISGWAYDKEWGKNCKIAKCLNSKNLKYCYECAGYDYCKTFGDFANICLKLGVDLRKNLKMIKKGKVDRWLEEQEKKWRCAECGKPISVDLKECHWCGTLVRL